MAPKIRPIRKTVSFQQSEGEHGVEEVVEAPIKYPQSENLILTFPVHTIVFIIALYQQGLCGRTKEVLVRGLFGFSLLQAIYGYLVVVALSPARAKALAKTKSKSSSFGGILLVIKAIAASGVLSVGFFVSLLLFGAPLATHLQETFILAVYLSLLVLCPVLILYRFDFQLLVKFFNSEDVLTSVFRNQVLSSSFFAIIGTWIGVLPIPLDWDRDWQKWPITLLTGGFLGSFVGALVSAVFSHLFPESSSDSLH